MANCITRHIPNAVTCCNLFSGCIAIVLAYNGNYHAALGFIILGAVFDFYAGTVKRAPIWWQRHSLEWLYRLLKEPKRMWRRYIIGNTLFLYNIFCEKLNKK